MRQISIGEVLRSAREYRGWSFTELQRATNIQAKYLQALEYNDFDFIPSEEYTRIFLKRYAEVLELDVDVILHAYETESLVVYYGVGDEEDVQSEFKRSYKARKKRGNYLPLLYLLLAATFILVFITYIVYSRVQNQTSTSTSSTSYSVVSSSSANVDSSSSTEASSTEASSSTSSSSSEESVILTTSGGGDDMTVTVSGTTGPVEVTLSATSVTSWVSLTDSDIVNGFTLSPTSTSVTATIPEGISAATLTLGVVDGVSVTIAGQTLDTSALTNQHGTVYLTIQ
ncbi:TPA: helix-turn-helix domain-containing protein [Streptococcus suis]